MKKLILLSLAAMSVLVARDADNTTVAVAYCEKMEARYVQTSQDALSEIANKYPKNKSAVYMSFWYAVGYLQGVCTLSIITKEVFVPYDELREWSNKTFSVTLDKMLGD